MNLSELNFLAIILAALSSFVLGGIWYSPWLFQGPWLDSCGLTELDLRRANPIVLFGVSLVLAFLATFALAVFLGPDPQLGIAVGSGFTVGLCWVATSFGISYLFEQRPLKLFLINGGYFVLQFSTIGLILGLWH